MVARDFQRQKGTDLSFHAVLTLTTWTPGLMAKSEVVAVESDP